MEDYLSDEDYRDIPDWSVEGRRQLLREHEAEIRLHLTRGFYYVDEEQPIPWRAFGFGLRGADPIDEAVEFAIERFRSEKDIDPRKMGAPMNFRMFTMGRWWLAQRYDAKIYARIMRSRRSNPQHESLELESDPPTADALDPKALLHGLIVNLGHTLALLYDRTCADLVAFWLDGTASLRAKLGDDRLAQELPTGSPSARTKHRADAMFRFWQLHAPAALDADLERVFKATLLTPCRNATPYRVRDGDAAARLGDVGGSHAVGHARKAACARVVLDFAARPKAGPGDDLETRISSAFLDLVLKKTLLHVLDITEHPLTRTLDLKEDRNDR